jgi:hypothetical protein
MRFHEITNKYTLAEAVKSTTIRGIKLNIDMDHLIQRMTERNLHYKEVGKMIENLPNLLAEIVKIEPGHQFWVWDPALNVGLGMRKINNNPTLTLKTAISSPPKGDRNPVITTAGAKPA